MKRRLCRGRGTGRSNKRAPTTEARRVGSRETGRGVQCDQESLPGQMEHRHFLQTGVTIAGFRGRDPTRGCSVSPRQEVSFAVALMAIDGLLLGSGPGLPQGANEMLGRADGLNTAGE